jgi:hypothetical protein
MLIVVRPPLLDSDDFREAKLDGILGRNSMAGSPRLST